MTDTISTDYAQAIVFEQHYIAKQEVSKHRWYTKQLIVFESSEFEGPMGFHYLEPASEIQEDQERFATNPVRIFPVEGREVVTTLWEAKHGA